MFFQITFSLFYYIIAGFLLLALLFAFFSIFFKTLIPIIKVLFSIVGLLILGILIALLVNYIFDLNLFESWNIPFLETLI